MPSLAAGSASQTGGARSCEPASTVDPERVAIARGFRGKCRRWRRPGHGANAFRPMNCWRNTPGSATRPRSG